MRELDARNNLKLMVFTNLLLVLYMKYRPFTTSIWMIFSASDGTCDHAIGWAWVQYWWSFEFEACIVQVVV